MPWGNAINALIAADWSTCPGLISNTLAAPRARWRSRRVASVSASRDAAWRCGDVTRPADAEGVAALAFSPRAIVAALRAVATRLLVLAALARDDVDAAVRPSRLRR